VTVRRSDIVVVGGGSAGCVVAARLSEDPARSVLLIEEGPDPQPIPDIIANPRRQGELILESDYVRLYDVERLDGSTFPLISGKVLGGGSSVNNLGVMRPLRRDFDAWARYGGPAWSYEALLPLAIGLEDDPDFPDSPLHGQGGPLRLNRAWTFDSPADPPVEAMLAVADELGIPRCEDMAVPEPYGLCMSPYNLVDGRRQSAVNAFLDPVRGRPNLTVQAGTRAIRLALDGSRVRAVEVAGPAGPETIEAGQVVVSAGTYQTPHLLLHSGIGPPGTIERVGLGVRHRLDGVGENFQDHAVVYLTFQGSAGLREDYLIPKVRLFVASTPGMDHGDLHILMHPSIRVEGMAPLLPVSVRLLEDRSPGRLWLASPDPADLPAIDPSILRHPDDRAAMLNGMRFAAAFVAQPRMARFYGQLVTPAVGDRWEEHAVGSHITYNHATGTCRLGAGGDPLAVVGPDLRVHGLDNLWLADMSVIPVIPHAPTNLTACLVGTIAARNVAAAG
jgi:choline dehydrogenase